MGRNKLSLASCVILLVLVGLTAGLSSCGGGGGSRPVTKPGGRGDNHAAGEPSAYYRADLGGYHSSSLLGVRFGGNRRLSPSISRSPEGDTLQFERPNRQRGCFQRRGQRRGCADRPCVRTGYCTDLGHSDRPAWSDRNSTFFRFRDNGHRAHHGTTAPRPFRYAGRCRPNHTRGKPFGESSILLTMSTGYEWSFRSQPWSTSNSMRLRAQRSPSSIWTATSWPAVVLRALLIFPQYPFFGGFLIKMWIKAAIADADWTLILAPAQYIVPRISPLTIRAGLDATITKDDIECGVSWADNRSLLVEVEGCEVVVTDAEMDLAPVLPPAQQRGEIYRRRVSGNCDSEEWCYSC